MEIGDIFFWTATVNNWYRLLENDLYKEIIIGSLNYLSEKGIADIFAFIIMPNHVHFIWRAKRKNGKETMQGSFLKYTAHEFKKLLFKNNSAQLHLYKVSAINKHYEFWQRDPLAIHLFTREVAYQKLDYLHNNPLAERWQLVTHPCHYKYSTARFYEEGKKDFSFIKDLRNEF
ncbi:transposase [Arachidicoccus ginsenosidimutans]|nr:transposase [Arachidicoccus sp. BS20]